MAVLKKNLIINGAERLLICDPEADTLADVLRRLGLTGTKIGCGAGQCGACSVLLDGRVVRSCAKKIRAVEDYSRVETIEGLGTANNLHPLQMAWMVHGAVQCGFCVPGFIMSAKGLLDKNSSPTRPEVRAWFQQHRNACRCTGYKQIVDAVMAAAQVLRGEMTMEELAWQMPAGGRIYGTSIPRPAALAKVLGACDYGDDIGRKTPHVLHLAVVMPGCSHANVRGIDFSEAEKAPGVFKVITAADVLGNNRIALPTGHPRALADGLEQPVISDKKVLRYGDVLALVAADTPARARAAAKLVKLDLEPLPEYPTALEAAAEDAREIHPGIPNLWVTLPVLKGRNTREVIDEADFSVEGSFYSTRQPHLIIEPDTGQAYLEDDGTLTIHCKALALTVTKDAIAEGIGHPVDKIRVILNPTGASFGYTMSPETPALLAVAALATKRPVSLTLSYPEHQHFTGKRAASFSNGRLSCDREGKLTGVEFELVFDKGCYTEYGAALAEVPLRFFTMPYSVPNVMGLSRAVLSNHAHSTAYRGYGSPQSYTASEQLMDMLARKAGIDPFEFRYRNVFRPGDTSQNGHAYSVYPMVEILDKMRPKYLALKERAARETTDKKKRGVGIVCGMYNVTGFSGDHAEVALELNPDGTVTHFNTWEDQGQGGDVGTLVLTHEALRPLGLQPDQIRLVMNDTAKCPDTGMAASSRSHFMAGNATIDAARQLMAAMRKPDGSWRSHAEMLAEGLPTKYTGVSDTAGTTSPLDPNTGQGNPSIEYTYGSFLAEVEVDVDTGRTTVVAMHCVGDVGVIGNRAVVDGQAYGGMMHTIGFALSENYYDVKKHATLAGAGFPYIETIPDGDDFTVDYVETPRPAGPNGSSGCSELFQTSGHVAIVNAIYDAVGVRVYDLPAAPAKVKALLEAKAAGRETVPEPYYFGEDFYDTVDDIRANPIVEG